MRPGGGSEQQLIEGDEAFMHFLLIELRMRSESPTKRDPPTDVTYERRLNKLLASEREQALKPRREN